MGTPLESRSGSHDRWVAEIVGPPGSGKSAVTQALGAHPALTRIGILRSATRMPVLLRHAASIVVRTAARSASRPRSVQELRWMARLQASPSLVRGRVAVVFDQGPVYTLARLREGMRTPTPWLTTQLRTWSELLTVVVLLDADDDVLLRRIDTREKQHALKGVHPDAARPGLARWRALYAEVVGQLTDGGGPVVVRFDTGVTSADEIARQVLATVPGARA